MSEVRSDNSVRPIKSEPRKVDMSSLWGIAGFTLRMLDLRLMRSFSERLAEADLTPAAATVVLLLQSNPGLSLGKLADAMMVKRPNMTKLVKRLEARALVRRSTAAGDKRSILLELTDRGQRNAKRLRALQLKHDDFALAALTSSERAQLLKLASRILATLDSESA
jgi:MarR family transcriptional regulator, temperature-dependent positive regulator of motility